MRGSYHYGHEEEYRMYKVILDLCDNKTEILDITLSNLNVSNCADFLEELGYSQDDVETNGWEAEGTYYYVHSYLPAIAVSGSVYLGELSIYFTKVDDEDIEELDVSELITEVEKFWSK